MHLLVALRFAMALLVVHEQFDICPSTSVQNLFGAASSKLGSISVHLGGFAHPVIIHLCLSIAYLR